MPTTSPLPTVMTGFRRDLVRWQQLVNVAWLAAWLAREPVAAAPTGEWRLLEVGCDADPDFLTGHVPGAGYLDTTELEQLPFWNKVPDADLLHCLLHHGIRHDTTVLLYSRSAIAAARAAHLMLYAGVRDVRLLDGGFAAWRQAGHPLCTAPPRTAAVASGFGASFPANPTYLLDTPRAKVLLQQSDGALVSIRTWNEFMGKTSGYSYIPAVGDIAGARWGHAGKGSDVNSMSDFQHADGTMRTAREIAAVWAGAGIRADQQVAFYCGTGWRASLAFFYAWLMGWERISVYDGGWFEWSADPGNPVVCRS
jgi:3-mercaptopyruvate sulfurtransferase SseA